VSALLEVEGVVRTFGGVRAVDGATLTVDADSITGLIGPNGAPHTASRDSALCGRTRRRAC
jgi:ABC-type branched-subunit amino acid transport system ATPase component